MLKVSFLHHYSLKQNISSIKLQYALDTKASRNARVEWWTLGANETAVTGPGSANVLFFEMKSELFIELFNFIFYSMHWIKRAFWLRT